MPINVIMPPLAEPVSLTEAKAHLRVEYDDDNTYISSLISAAREFAETYQGRAIITQTLELTIDNWPDKSYIELPRPKLQQVLSLIYKDRNGTQNTWSPEDFIVDSNQYRGRIVLPYGCDWPGIELYPSGAIGIRYIAGYHPDGEDLVANVPTATKQAILLLVGHLYENREAINIGNIVTEIPFTVKALLNTNRVIAV